MRAILLPLGALMLAAGARAAEPIEVGNRRQLLFDDRFVQQATNLAFVVHSPRNTGERILVSDPEWPLSGYHSVLYHAGTYHLWYSSGGCVLYARSRDGIHFHKPPLHLRREPFEDGRQPPPNVVLGRGVGGVKGRMHGLQVFVDPNAPENERFKLVANPEEFRSQLQIFASPDGVHWTLRHRDVLTFDPETKPHHLDSQNVIFWDTRLRKYVAYFRRNLRDPTAQCRTVARTELADLDQSLRVLDAPIVLRLDELYPPRALRAGQRTSAVDVYASGALQYPWAQDAYFMFPWQYYHYDESQAEFRNERPTNAGIVDARFAASRDGIRWQRYDARPWVSPGLKGEFDSRRIYMVYGLVPGAADHELYMYYLGCSDTHGWGRDDRNNRLLTAAGLAPTGPNAISRLVLRRDGFVSVRAGLQQGEFVTPPLRFTGEQLLLNIDTSASGEARVEIQDANGQPIAGFSLADCDLIHSANEIHRPVRWNGKSDLSALAGRPVRRRFVLRDLDLYAFQFADRGGI